MNEKNIFRLILIFITFIHFEGFLKLYFDYHPIIHGFKYVFAVIFFLIWVIDIRTFKTELSYPIALFSIFVLIQLINPLMLQGKGILLSMLGLFYQIGYLPLFFIGYKIINQERIKKLMYWIIGLSSLSAITAHIQSAIGVPQFLVYMPYKSTEFVLSHVGAYGPIAFDLVPPVSWYLIGLIFCMYFVLLNKNKLLFSLLGLNLLAANLMTGKRIGIVILFITVAIFLIFRIKQTLQFKNIKKIVIAFLFCIIILIFFFTTLANENQRERYLSLKNPIKAYLKNNGFTWINMINLILKYPFGGGLRHANIIPNERFGIKPLAVYTGDNYLNIVFGELGVPGFFSLIILFYFILKIGIKNYFEINNKESKLIISCLLSIIISFMISSIYGTPNGWAFWLFLGIIINIPNLHLNQEKEEVNKTIEGSKTMISLKNIFKDSIFNKIIKVKKDFILFDIIKESKASLFFLRILDIIKNSTFYKLIKRIID